MARYWHYAVAWLIALGLGEASLGAAAKRIDDPRSIGAPDTPEPIAIGERRRPVRLVCLVFGDDVHNWYFARSSRFQTRSDPRHQITRERRRCDTDEVVLHIDHEQCSLVCHRFELSRYDSSSCLVEAWL